MKIYGLTKKTKDQLLGMKQISITAEPQVLRELADFLSSCAEKMEDENTEYDHEHFISKTTTKGQKCDIVVLTPEFLE